MIKTKITLLFCLLLFLASCQTQSPITPSIVNTNIPETTQTINPEINSFPTIIPTPRPTNMATFTPTITWTPLPTLSESQTNAKIKELLETNGGCELPCWWGITPGSTAWLEALHFLNPLVFDLYQSEPYASVESPKRHINIGVEFYYPLPDKVSSGRVSILVKDNIVYGITIFSPGAEFRYQLHQILGLLGLPKQIFISAQQSAPVPQLPPARLVLDYSDVGIWVSYGYIPTQIGENLVICPQTSLGKVSPYNDIGGSLRLFVPELTDSHSFSIQEYVNRIGGKYINEVTNMDIETFYNTFLEPTPSNCLETPANLWP